MIVSDDRMTFQVYYPWESEQSDHDDVERFIADYALEHAVAVPPKKERVVGGFRMDFLEVEDEAFAIALEALMTSIRDRHSASGG